VLSPMGAGARERRRRAPGYNQAAVPGRVLSRLDPSVRKPEQRRSPRQLGFAGTDSQKDESGSLLELRHTLK